MLRLLASACLVFVALASAARADLVVLHDGRVFVGLIKSETRQQVVIDTVVANVRSTMTFKRSEVERIEKGELPPGFFGPGAPGGATPAAPAPEKTGAPASTAGATKYLEIPLVGTFGEEIMPDGVESSLSWAQKQGVKHVVFRIKSGGGRVDTATEISKVMDRFGGGMTYYALVESAISASIWVAFGCDRIFMTPGGTMGGAVAFSQNRSTGAAEVDAKMNSIFTAEVVAIASKKGHNADVIRAMMLTDASLHSWTDEGGVLRLGADAPKGQSAPKAERIDGPATVLTLTSGDAERLGVAAVLPGGLDALGQAVGLEGWTSAGPFGVNAMKRSGTQRSKSIQRGETDEQKVAELVRNIGLQSELIDSNIAEAVNLHPANYSDYFINRTTGHFTPESQNNWRKRTDEALAGWKRVANGVATLEKLMKDAEKFGADTTDFKVRMRNFKQQVDREVQRLRDERNKTRV